MYLQLSELYGAGVMTESGVTRRCTSIMLKEDSQKIHNKDQGGRLSGKSELPSVQFKELCVSVCVAIFKH